MRQYPRYRTVLLEPVENNAPPPLLLQTVGKLAAEYEKLLNGIKQFLSPCDGWRVQRHRQSDGHHKSAVSHSLIITQRNEPKVLLQLLVVMAHRRPRTSFSRGGDMTMDFLVGNQMKSLKGMGGSAMELSMKHGMSKGYEVGNPFLTITGRRPGPGEPVRVTPGQSVLFHILNGGAGEIRSLAMPGVASRLLR
jgi:hypothetical protein